MKFDNLRRPAALGLLAFAAFGLPMTAVETGCTTQVRDPVTQEWREPTPQEIATVQAETGAIVKTIIEGTPAAPIIPWIDAALRLGALLAAWRVVPSTTVATVITPPAAGGQGPPVAGSPVETPVAVVVKA